MLQALSVQKLMASLCYLVINHADMKSNLCYLVPSLWKIFYFDGTLNQMGTVVVIIVW